MKVNDGPMSWYCSHRVIIHSVVLLILAWSLVSTWQGEWSLYYWAVNYNQFVFLWQINLRWCFPTMAFAFESCITHNISSLNSNVGHHIIVCILKFSCGCFTSLFMVLIETMYLIFFSTHIWTMNTSASPAVFDNHLPQCNSNKVSAKHLVTASPWDHGRNSQK